MKSPSPPPAPDPAATAQAQAGLNRDTAITQAGLNMTNQRGPQGSLTYNQIGQWSDGTPRFEAVQDLSPEQQELYDLGTRTQRNIGQIGVEQSGRIGALLNEPLNLDNEATEARLMELGRKRLDPMLEQRRKSAEQALINKGVRPGTEAYDREIERLTQGENDAFNQLLLSGRGQAIQEALTERNQPLNEINALMSGSQVSQPNFINTPQTGVAQTDIIGPTALQHQTNMAGWQAGQNSKNALTGGLFSLGGAALGGWGSTGFKPFW